jgi:hypothetical protein
MVVPKYLNCATFSGENRMEENKKNKMKRTTEEEKECRRGLKSK